VALRNGSPLVPVFSFGENDLWEQLPNPDGSMLRKFQDMSRKYTNIVPVIKGKGRAMKPLFVSLALDNIWNVYETVLNSGDSAKIEKIVKSLDVKVIVFISDVQVLPRELKSKETRPLLQTIMAQW
jgi:translation elongation factor EF-G